MKISQDVRERFKDKSAEFLELGGTVYVEQTP